MQLLYQIGITLIPGIGDINGKRLIAHCGGVEALFKEKKSNLLTIPGLRKDMINAIKSAQILKRAEEELKFVEKKKIQPIFYLDNLYPHRLKHCIDGPIMLYYKGNADLNKSKVVAIVGTRNITIYGQELCEQLIQDLADLDVLIVSGLAYGIDTKAHKCALRNKMETIGVFGHGLDKVYPPENRELSKKMIEQGGLLTEFKSKSRTNPENFPKRNRIVAGMSDAVIVIESAVKGGALITADIANSYNRDVFAFPGRVSDRCSEGCNFLIKTNRAALIQHANDLKYIMGWDDIRKNKRIQKQLFVELDKEEQHIMNVLKQHQELGIDQLSILSELPISKIAAKTLSLEFKGLLYCLPGKIIKLA